MAANGSFLPVRAGFARWLQTFRDAWFIPCTAAGVEWQGRDVRLAMAHVPGRMVDAVDEMLKAWRTNANSTKPGSSAFLPVMLVAVANDLNPLPPEYGHTTLLRPMFVQLPGSTRWVKLRTTMAALRAQLVVVAADIETARDMAAQFLSFTLDVAGTSFSYTANTADQLTAWPCQVRAGDAYAVAEQAEQNRVRVFRIDVELVPTVPHIDAGPNGEGYAQAGAAVISSGGQAATPSLEPMGSAVSMLARTTMGALVPAPPSAQGSPHDLLGGFEALMQSLSTGARGAT